MAWYYGTFSCGHEGRVNIIGPVKDRQWKADNRFSGLCPKCYEKALQERREKENAEAAEKSKEMELPELLGTPKQIAWANTLRLEMIEKWHKVVNHFAKECKDSDEDEIEKFKKMTEEALDYTLAKEIKSSWYIENRNHFDDFDFVQARCCEWKEEVLDHGKEKQKQEKKIEKDIKLESTIYPENKITNSIVEISTVENVIKAKFEKNSTFIELVKYLDYEWKDGVWQREITEYSGPIEDRIVELGNELLNKGFPVMILDPELRERAIKGEYTPEQTRWIKIRGTGDYKGWLSISWNGRNKELYEKARLIAGSRYSSPAVVVKVEHYREVEDFSEMFGFKFSEKAQKAIEEYKEAEKNIPVVQPEEVEKEEKKDKLQEILDSGTDILDDLKD